ncbi:MAG TPA: hypothetical protein PKA58_22900, partial [Polyangium sp.]|nr:hypothetical protein [Polyangium sp.]
MASWQSFAGVVFVFSVVACEYTPPTSGGVGGQAGEGGMSGSSSGNTGGSGGSCAGTTVDG